MGREASETVLEPHPLTLGSTELGSGPEAGQFRLV